MQTNDRSTYEGLPDVLDQALARLRAGESVEACLNAYPQHARDLEPLLRAGASVRAQASAALPPEMDEWLAVGARDFAAIAAQMAPKAKPAAQPSPRRDFADLLDDALARAGRGEPAAALLASFPDHAADLDPLVRLGTRVRASALAPLPAEMEAWLPAGKREFMAIAEQMAPRFATQRRRAATRRLTAQRAAVAVVLVGVMMGAVDTASAQSVPGDTLYTWKRAHENISLALTADPQERSQLFVEYAGRRLQEFNSLVAAGDNADTVLVAETLNSLLDNVQGALVINDTAQTPSVAPAVKQILSDTKSAITQAAVASPSSTPVLDQALARATVIDENIVPSELGVVPGTATARPSGNNNHSVTEPSPGTSPLPSSAPATVAPAPTAPDTGASPAPTLAPGETAPPANVPTALPVNTPTIDPATVLPATSEPTSDPGAPPASTATSGPVLPGATPTSLPTVIPTDTAVPTATALPVTEVATEPPPPTPPPATRPPRPTQTDTPPPPTDTPPPPTDVPPTPTDVPPTPTDVPPTPTDVPPTPTDTPLVVNSSSAADQTATASAGAAANRDVTPTPQPTPTP